MQLALQKGFGDILKCSGATEDILKSLSAQFTSAFSALFQITKQTEN
jgi:hypothetical protein